MVNKAPCRVILTAPPAWRIEQLGAGGARAARAAETRTELPTGHPLPGPVPAGARPAAQPHAPRAAADPDGLPSPDGAGPISDPAAG